MNYNHPQLIEELAAQYALGTLRGPARRRFEQLCLRDVVALNAVRWWEDRLIDLTAQVRPVAPSAAVWTQVQERLGHSRKTRENRGLWSRMQWAFAAGIAVIAAAVVWWTLLSQPAAQLVATIADQQQTQLWRIEARPDREELRVAALPALSQDAQHAYELWALPTQPGGAPVSLGLMPQTGKRALHLSAAQRAALAGAQQVAISLEPPGGSPTGAPTGPVLFVAKVVGNG